jgi:hypothetical protein
MKGFPNAARRHLNRFPKAAEGGFFNAVCSGFLELIHVAVSSFAASEIFFNQ